MLMMAMDINMIPSLGIACLLPLLLLLLWKRASSRASHLPPGPRRLPIWGNLHQLGAWPHRSLHDLAKVHGPLMYLKLGTIPVLVVSSADLARETIKDHDMDFTGRPSGAASRKLSYGCLDIVFSPYGDYWRHIRKVCAQKLLSLLSVQSFRPVREKEVEQMMQIIGESCNKGAINMSEILLGFTNNIICKAAFGAKFGGHGGKGIRFQGIMGESEAILVGFGIGDFFPWLKWINLVTGFHQKLEKVFQAVDGFFEEVIEEHLDPKRPPPEHEDFIDVMLRVQKNPSVIGPPLTREHIKAVIMDMFLGGTETTSATLVWTMTQLVVNPMVMKKAQQEVRTVFKGKGRVEEDDLHHLTYLKLVIKEVLRIHPPLPLLVPRECTKQCNINGYDIPIKTRLFVNLWSIMRDPNLWDDPEEFKPERFSGSSLDFKGKNFEYIPFGSGRRSCPGSLFGMATVELALASLLYGYDWELPEGVKKEVLDMGEAPGLALHKKVALYLVAKPWIDEEININYP